MESLRGDSRGGKVVLTPRDYAILMMVAENRFVSANEIRDAFWKVRGTLNHYTRIRQLVNVGILEYLIGDAGNRLGLRLTRKGIDLLPSEIHKGKALSYRSFSYRTSFDHDKLLQKVRLVFEQSSLVSNYMLEHEVRQLLASRHGKKERRDDGYKVPDGLFDLKTARRTLRVALELELTMKSEIRYRKIFRELLTSTDFDVVIIITANEQMIEAMRSIINRVKADDPVVRDWPYKRGVSFATLEKVLTEEQNVVFTGDGQPFSLASLAKDVAEKAQGSIVPQ